jgi:FkbM family methyltransferase
MKLTFLKKIAAVVVLVPAIFFFLALWLIPKDSKYSVPSVVNKVSTSACLRWTMYRDNEFKTDFFGMTYFGRAGNLVDAAIRCHGAHEKPFLFLMRDIANLLNDKGLTLFDVGANVGQHTLYMSTLGKEVHSFEPYPPVFTRLKQNVENNNLKNVFLYPIGLGETEMEHDFYEPPESNLGSGSFVRKLDNTTKVLKSIKVVVGDEWVTMKSIPRVDLIKMDIEGYEKPALMGLKKTIDKNRPILLVELTFGLETSFKTLKEFDGAFPSNYKFAKYCELNMSTGRYRLCDYTFDPTEPGLHDIVAYPVERASLIKRLM